MTKSLNFPFDILIDDCLYKITTEIIHKQSSGNEFLLSVVNGYEDNHWLQNQFIEFIYNNIIYTALNAEEREKYFGSVYTSLAESAKHLRIVDDCGNGSEIAEIVLYGIMKHHFNAISATPKIYYKQNDNDNAKGADSVHIVLTEDYDFQLWLGEAKFYSEITNVRLFDPIISIRQMLLTNILRKEIGIMTNLKDLDNQILDSNLLKKIKAALQQCVSIDEIKPKIHVPILLLHECKITAESSCLNDEYKNKIIEHHKERATAFFDKMRLKLKDEIVNYEHIKFHLILFPIPDKKTIVSAFFKQAKVYRDE